MLVYIDLENKMQDYKYLEDYNININKKELEDLCHYIEFLRNEFKKYDDFMDRVKDALEDYGYYVE